MTLILKIEIPTRHLLQQTLVYTEGLLNIYTYCTPESYCKQDSWWKRIVVENKTITAYKTVLINVASFLHSNTEENDVKCKIDILNWTLIVTDDCV